MRHDLIGYWSADAACPTIGAMSDERLVFKPNGIGYMAVLNVDLTSADVFRWHLVDPSHLRLSGEYELYPSDDFKSLVKQPSAMEEVFEIDLYIKETRLGTVRALKFTHGPWFGVANEFGFCSGLVSNDDEPDFSWMERYR